MQQVDRRAYDSVWRAVETGSTDNAVNVAIEHGMQPPTDAAGWDVVMSYQPDGSVELVWDRAVRVVIDPEGFDYDGPAPGPEAMQVPRDVYDRILHTADVLDDASAIAEFVRAQGVEPPDSSPGWEVYLDAVTGRGAQERPVWYRDQTILIRPDDAT